MWPGRTLILFLLVAAVLPRTEAKGAIQTADETAPHLPERRVLTNTSQFRELTVPQAIQGWPIRWEGIVTLVDTNRYLIVLQDNSGALAIRGGFQSANIRPGQRIRLETEYAVPSVTAFPDFPGNASGSDWLPSFSAPTNWGRYYLARMRGLLTPPTTGDYTFWIASKGASELWLSANADGSRIERIASVGTERATVQEQWGKYPSQRSRVIHLQAGQSYLIDAIQEQHGGRDDLLSVAWRGPGLERSIIDGRFLSPCENPKTNGIVREYWNDYFVAAVEPLTASNAWNSILVVKDPRVTVLGNESFPQAKPMKAGMPIAPADNYRWVELESAVEFAAEHDGSLTLELIHGRENTRALVSGWNKTRTADFRNSRVRIRGVCEGVINAAGEQVAGIIHVPGPEFVEILSDTAGLSELKFTPIADLTPANPNLAWGRQVRIRGVVVRQNVDGIVIRGPGSFTGYVSRDGVHWKQLAPAVEIAMASTALAGFSVSSFRADSLTTAVFDSVSGLTGTGRGTDISRSSPPGKAAFADSVYTIKGGGIGIASSFDQFHFVHQPIAGDGEILARIKSLEGTNPRAVAGIMIRESLDGSAGFANLALNANGSAVFQFRQKSDERGATITLPNYSPPCWLKLTRQHVDILARPDRSFSVQPGEEVDVAGSLEWDNDRPILRSVRRANQLATDPLTSPPASASDAVNPMGEPPTVPIRQLIPEEGESLRDGSGIVRVRGVVTFNHRVFGLSYLAIQDESAGVLVRLTSRFARKPLQVGERAEFDLRSVNGKWPVPLEPTRISVIGMASLPEPVVHPAEYSLPQRGEGHWVEMEGIIRSANPRGTLTLMGKDGVTPIWIAETTLSGLRGYVDALVRVRGVLVRNGQNARMLLVPSAGCLEVTEPPPEQPFVIPAIPIASLNNFSQRSSPFHRVKINGVLTCRKDDVVLVQDSSGGARVSTSALASVKVGDRIEAVGFPESDTGLLTLSEALVQRIGTGQLPEPLALSTADLQQGRHDAVMIRLTGQLLQQQVTGEDEILELQSGQRLFHATLAKGRDRLPTIPAGSQVEVTGVCWTKPVATVLPSTPRSQPMVTAFEVLLRTPADVVVRHRPPWWTWKHTASTIGSLVAILAVALIWIRLLHRQVAQRTGELQSAMKKLERETEISATLAERNRLAGEIHDGLEQGLSGIMMQLDGLESKLAESPGEASRHLKLARSMVRFSRTEVRHSLWDWKSPALADKDLGGALTEIASHMSAGNQANVSVRISGSTFALPPATEHHLLRIGQEALNNALKYAQAKTIEVNLDYSDRSIRLAVQDDGRGFVPEAVMNGTAGHLGLQSLRSRTRKMGGRFSVTSAPGSGTVIEVIVPISEGQVRPTTPDQPLSST